MDELDLTPKAFVSREFQEQCIPELQSCWAQYVASGNDVEAFAAWGRDWGQKLCQAYAFVLDRALKAEAKLLRRNRSRLYT